MSSVADKIIDLANFLCDRAKTAFVLANRERDKNQTRLNGVNDILQATSERKRVKTYLSGERYFSKKDLYLLNNNGLKNL